MNDDLVFCWFCRRMHVATAGVSARQVGRIRPAGLTEWTREIWRVDFGGKHHGYVAFAPKGVPAQKMADDLWAEHDCEKDGCKASRHRG